MFLTNNYSTINNLMICSRGDYIFRLFIGSSYRKINLQYQWVIRLQKVWSSYLKNKDVEIEIDYTMKPYGNIQEIISLITDENGKSMVCNERGVNVFNE